MYFSLSPAVLAFLSYLFSLSLYSHRFFNIMMILFILKLFFFPESQLIFFNWKVSYKMSVAYKKQMKGETLCEHQNPVIFNVSGSPSHVFCYFSMIIYRSFFKFRHSQSGYKSTSTAPKVNVVPISKR